MLLISSTRSLSTARPITDPILNCHHIQPAAAGAAAVGPWLCQFHTPSSPNSLTSPYSPALHLDQLSTTSASAPTPAELSLQAPPLPPLAPHSPSSASSSSPSTLPQSSNLTATASPPSCPTSVVLPAAPANATMHPTSNTNSDDDSSTPEVEQSLSTTQINPSPHSLSLYDFPSSSVPPASASSSSFPSTLSRPQLSTFPSHPDHDHQNQNQNQHHHHQQQQHYQQRPQHPQPHHPYSHSPSLPSPSHHSSQVPNTFDQRHHPSLFLAHQSFNPRPQSAPHPTTRSALDPAVMAAASTKVEVKRWDEDGTIYFQVAHDGHTVARVRDTGMVNGTKLLNLAGISRGKRDGILKNEKIRTVIKHGTMHLKGVWISFERAQALAEQYTINDKVFPLLVTNLEDYINIDQAIMMGGSKLAVQPIMQQPPPRHHPHAQQQPAKFTHLGLTIPPSSAGPHGYSSAAGWPARPSPAATVGYNEPYSAPAVAQNAPGSAGSNSVYSQAQLEFLNSAGSRNPNLPDRRQTIASNTYNGGFHSMASLGSPQTALSYSSPYSTTQFAGYHSRTGPSEIANPGQFEYHPGSHHNGSFSGSSGSGTAYQGSLYHSQLGSAPPTASSAATKPSPALHSAQLVGAASPGPSPVQLLGPPAGSFKLGGRLAGPGSSGGVKREVDEGGVNDAQFRRVQPRMREESPNESSGSFRGSVAGSRVSGALGDWNIPQTGMISATPGRMATTNQGEEAQSRSPPGESPTVGSGQANGSSGSSNNDPQQLWQQQAPLPEVGFHVADQHVGGAHPEPSSHHQWQS